MWVWVKVSVDLELKKYDREGGHVIKYLFSMDICRWVNRKDPHGRNIFSGGFLGLDNIGTYIQY